MLPEYVWDAGVLEGNPFTFPEVKTLNPELSLVRGAPAITQHRFDDPLPEPERPTPPARREPDSDSKSDRDDEDAPRRGRGADLDSSD